MQEGGPKIGNINERWQLWFTVAMCSAVATLLGVASAGENVHTLDLRISTRLQAWQGSFPEALQRLGDMLGGTRFTLIAALVVLAWCARQRCWRDCAFVIVVIALRLAGTGIKPLFDSPRPEPHLVEILRTYESYGYPSGHSMSIVMSTTALAIVAWRHTTNVTVRTLTAAVAVSVTVLVGWSRIWSGAHWPSDVLGGWLYGIAFVLIAFAIGRGFAARGEAI